MTPKQKHVKSHLFYCLMQLLLEDLDDLKKEYGFTAIFISHDLSVVRYISDRIMVMNKGKIEETGPADDIYFNPQAAYTKKLIAAIPAGIIS